MNSSGLTIDTETDPATLDFAPDFNAAAWFVDRHVDAGRSADPAIIEAAGDGRGPRTISYGELAKNVNRAGNALLDGGMRPGDRVLMVVKDCAEFFYVFWGAIKAGIVPVPVNVMLRSDDLAFMISDSEVTAVTYSPEFASEVVPALLRAGTGAQGLVVDADGGFVSRISEASDELTAVPAGPDAVAFWLYSSGTTGRPKGVVHYQRDAPFTAEHYAVGVLGMNSSDRCFSAAKLFFAYGLGNAMTFPLHVGGTAILDDRRPTPDTTFETIAEQRPTIFFGVPTLYAAQLQLLDAAGVAAASGGAETVSGGGPSVSSGGPSVSGGGPSVPGDGPSVSGDGPPTRGPTLDSLRLCVSAGEALPGDLFRRWHDATGVEILDGIGSTEALHIFISNRPGEVRPGTTGVPVPGYDARIVDEEGGAAPPGEPGQLEIRGGSIMSGYWKRPIVNEITLVDGWLRTGDQYVQDEDGYFQYQGRADDMIKVGGIWCSPFDIEARLIEHPSVLEAAVVGRADDNELIKPEAYVVLSGADATPELEAELVAHCQDGLPRYMYPRWIHFVDELPKTATGKIQRFKLRN